MINVTILGFDQALASAITGAIDLFSLAGITWQRIQAQAPTPRFKISLASIDGRPIRCINQMQLQVHHKIEDIKHSHLLLVPTIGGPIEQVLKNNVELIEWIKQSKPDNSDIASNCTGSFFLAEAGLLEGKEATTHWGFANQFMARYPNVNLQPHKLITQQDNIFCAGGGMAWFDLALLLIERYCNKDIAMQTAKSHVIDMSRTHQSIYANVQRQHLHQDPDINDIQDWFEQHFHEVIHLSEVAEKFNLTTRTFIRRFKRATGQTPLSYLQRLRIDAAKNILETSHCQIEQVISEVGYEDISAFTRLFKKHTGITPSQYRKKFSR
ncbi:GlxA family transcriptional regulator [Agarilytica rhodophyticola]|uniref:GlxA family transcriptional regulator n=1 Tax=Agarilytica rhodophyticola TaxID=1737490 RepID=UPI000B345A01|nr:helix-turn-helix domain-containing protein [Agarilytica rhodophyticola]